MNCLRDKLKQEDCNSFVLSNFQQTIVDCILTDALNYNTQ